MSIPKETFLQSLAEIQRCGYQSGQFAAAAQSRRKGSARRNRLLVTAAAWQQRGSDIADLLEVAVYKPNGVQRLVDFLRSKFAPSGEELPREADVKPEAYGV